MFLFFIVYFYLSKIQQVLLVLLQYLTAVAIKGLFFQRENLTNFYSFCEINRKLEI